MSDLNPPAAAVARDPHWAAKMKRLRDRRPAEQDVTLHDDAAVEAVQDAQSEALRVVNGVIDEWREAGKFDETQATYLAQQMAVEADPRVQAQRAIVTAAAEAKAESDVTFRFRALRGDVWEQLLSEHQPTKDQVDRGEVYNVQTFAPALIAACSLDEITYADVMEWWPNLAQGEQSLLFGACVTINQGARASLGKGSSSTGF